MIGYEKFRKEIINRIKSYLPESYLNWKLKVETVYRVNETLDSLVLQPPGKQKNRAVPRFYIQDYYRLFKNGASADFILRMIAARIQNAPSTEEEEKARFDSLKVQDDVVVQLISRKRNKELLKEIPYRNFLDLAVIYRILVFDRGGRWVGAIVNNAMMEAMSITEEELYERAYRHTPEVLPAKMTDTSQLLFCKGDCREDCETECSADCGEDCCKEIWNKHSRDDKLRKQRSGILILTNDSAQFGAATMLYKENLDRACEMLDSNIYILPGSMHELYIVREEPERLKFYRQLVASANEDVVDVSEWLSDQVYRYDRVRKKLGIAL